MEEIITEGANLKYIGKHRIIHPLPVAPQISIVGHTVDAHIQVINAP